MADLNALIAQGAQFRVPPPVDPMGNMPQLMQMQSMQQQNQLNQMTMQEKQRGQQEMNALRRLDPSSATYLQDVKQINPKMGFEFEKMQQDAKSADTEGQIKKVKLLTDKLALLPDAYRRADTPEAYLALHHSIHADPVVGSWLKSTGATLESGLETIKNAVDTGKFNELRTGSMQSVSQLLDSLKPLIVPANASVYAGGAFKQAPAAPTAPVKSIANVNPNDFTPASLAKFNASGNYGDLVAKPVDRAPAQVRESAPVAVVGGDGKIRYVSREEAISKGMTPANTAEKPMSALQKQAFKKDFANDTSKVQSAISTADELEKLTDELVGNPDKKINPHPGLGGITGYLGILPSLPKGEAAKAEQKLDTFKGKIKSLGRAIASQEGKLGNMAVQEWQMVSDAVQNISPRAGNLDVQMRDVVRQARDLARNMKEKFDLTYEDTAPATAPKEVNFGDLRK